MPRCRTLCTEQRRICSQKHQRLKPLSGISSWPTIPLTACLEEGEDDPTLFQRVVLLIENFIVTINTPSWHKIGRNRRSRDFYKLKKALPIKGGLDNVQKQINRHEVAQLGRYVDVISLRASYRRYLARCGVSLRSLQPDEVDQSGGPFTPSPASSPIMKPLYSDEEVEVEFPMGSVSEAMNLEARSLKRKHGSESPIDKLLQPMQLDTYQDGASPSYEAPTYAMDTKIASIWKSPPQDLQGSESVDLHDGFFGSSDVHNMELGLREEPDFVMMPSVEFQELGFEGDVLGDTLQIFQHDEVADNAVLGLDQPIEDLLRHMQTEPSHNSIPMAVDFNMFEAPMPSFLENHDPDPFAPMPQKLSHRQDSDKSEAVDMNQVQEEDMFRHFDLPYAVPSAASHHYSPIMSSNMNYDLTEDFLPSLEQFGNKFQPGPMID